MDAEFFIVSCTFRSKKKSISQAATLHLYQTTHACVKGYHDLVLGKINLYGKKIATPPKVIVNEHKMPDFQKALLEGYKALDNSEFNLSLYKTLREPFSKRYSIFNDGIQKFTKELQSW